MHSIWDIAVNDKGKGGILFKNLNQETIVQQTFKQCPGILFQPVCFLKIYFNKKRVKAIKIDRKKRK